MNPLFRNVGYAVIVVMAGIYVFLEMTGPRGLNELLRKRSRIAELQSQNAELARQNEQREERIRRLVESREEQELEIRRRFKLQKKDSVDFYLPQGEAEPNESENENEILLPDE